MDSLDYLTRLIAEAQAGRSAAERELADLDTQVREVARRLETFRIEEEFFTASLARRDPERSSVAREPVVNADERASVSEGKQPDAPFVPVDGDDWRAMPRTTAVEKAIVEIVVTDEFASPAAIESRLRFHGRDDSRDDIGAALAYLNGRKGTVRSEGRGRWVLRQDFGQVDAARPDDITEAN